MTNPINQKCCGSCWGRMGTLAGGGIFCADSECGCHSNPTTEREVHDCKWKPAHLEKDCPEVRFVTYSQRDHTHCWTTESPPCGIKGEHRCCLCEKPAPTTPETPDDPPYPYARVRERDVPETPPLIEESVRELERTLLTGGETTFALKGFRERARTALTRLAEKTREDKGAISGAFKHGRDLGIRAERHRISVEVEKMREEIDESEPHYPEPKNIHISLERARGINIAIDRALHIINPQPTKDI